MLVLFLFDFCLYASQLCSENSIAISCPQGFPRQGHIHHFQFFLSTHVLIIKFFHFLRISWFCSSFISKPISFPVLLFPYWFSVLLLSVLPLFTTLFSVVSLLLLHHEYIWLHLLLIVPLLIFCTMYCTARINKVVKGVLYLLMFASLSFQLGISVCYSSLGIELKFHFSTKSS